MTSIGSAGTHTENLGFTLSDVLIIKIDGVANTGSYGSSVVGWNNANYMIFVNSQKTSITNNSDYNGSITKIIGFLKQPAMIYTGKELFAGNGVNIENGVISSTFKKEMLFDWYRKFNCAGGVIPLTREQVNQYDYIQLEIHQWNAGNSGIIAKTDWFIEAREPYTLLNVEKTIYSERKAQMVTIRLSSNGSQIDLSGIVASPYGSNTALTSDAHIFIGAVWGIKL